jgi:hypothetical protein
VCLLVHADRTVVPTQRRCARRGGVVEDDEGGDGVHLSVMNFQHIEPTLLTCLLDERRLVLVTKLPLPLQWTTIRCNSVSRTIDRP